GVDAFEEPLLEQAVTEAMPTTASAAIPLLAEILMVIWVPSAWGCYSVLACSRRLDGGTSLVKTESTSTSTGRITLCRTGQGGAPGRSAPRIGRLGRGGGNET